MLLGLTAPSLKRQPSAGIPDGHLFPFPLFFLSLISPFSVPIHPLSHLWSFPYFSPTKKKRLYLCGKPDFSTQTTPNTFCRVMMDGPRSKGPNVFWKRAIWSPSYESEQELETRSSPSTFNLLLFQELTCNTNDGVHQSRGQVGPCGRGNEKQKKIWVASSARQWS